MAKALYRQYRPKTFGQVLGQDRVVNVLRNQVKSNKISHAYLFSGERGTGKTSCAKIFAKAINCLNPTDGSPCLECENCKLIEQEATIDVVEMDAASNRRIDDIRNLKDNVIYPPNKLKYKVYIIDEAHMITKEAFNALLKIMEEPPNHLVFILATTEIEKVPNTILSRVQKFEFNKIDENQIRIQIQNILDDKDIKMDKEAIDLIINKANGAMRDALSILDQVISLEDNTYSLNQVENILGVVDFYQIDKLTAAIIGKNSKASLEYIYDIRDNGRSNKDVFDSLINYLRDIMVYKMTDDDKYFDNQQRLSYIKERTNQITDQELSDYLDLLVEYSNKLKITENTDVLTELAILRLINLKNISNLESRISYLERNSGDDLIDTINTIVDSRLKALDLNKIKDLNDNASVNPTGKASRSEENLSKDDKKDPQINELNIDKRFEDNKLDVRNPVTTTKNSKSQKLSKVDEVKVKQMIIDTAGGAINGLYSDEGFNYDIIDDEFIMYVKDNYYKIFIATKLGDLEKNISDILKRKLTFRIETSKIVDSKPIDESEEFVEIKDQNEEKPDHSAKLREVFGDELIIE